MELEGQLTATCLYSDSDQSDQSNPFSPILFLYFLF